MGPIRILLPAIGLTGLAVHGSTPRIVERHGRDALALRVDERQHPWPARLPALQEINGRGDVGLQVGHHPLAVLICLASNRLASTSILAPMPWVPTAIN
jgi:hypothetical protein